LQKSVKRQLEPQALLDDGYEHVSRDGNPDLRLHGVLRSPIERFDPKVLLDPAEEQLNSPTQFIEHGYGQRRKDKIIGQEDQVAVVLPIVEPDTAQLVGESVVGIKTRKENGLVADQVRRLIDGPRIQPTALKIRFGADDKEGLAQMNEVETGKIEIGAVKHIETAGFGNQVIQDPDIVHFPVCYLDKRGDGASQIEKGMKFDGAFVFAEDGPGEKRKTEVDRCGIEGIDGLLEFQTEIIVGIEIAGLMDEHLGEVRVNPPVTGFIGVGQGVTGNVAADPHVIQSILHRTQAGLNVAEPLPKSQLSEGHTEELIETGEAFDLVVATVSLDAFSELIKRQEIHNLGEDGRRCIHRSLLSVAGQKSDHNIKSSSNRLRPESLVTCL
jgi:hypothetical protein